jgi:acetate kinase
MTKEASVKPAHPCILTIKGGSSSIKLAVFEVGDSLRRMLEGAIERIGLLEPTWWVKGVNQASMIAEAVCRVLGLDGKKGN